MAERKQRSASFLAASVAVPIAIIVGLIIFLSLHSSAARSDAANRSSASPSVAAKLTPVDMAAPKLSDRHTTMCLAFTSQIPVTTDNASGVLYLGKLAERTVTAGAEQNAAFGDPAITAACGAPAAKPGATDEVLEMNGVCWYPQTGANATTFTTLDREVPVAVTVPNSYAQPAQYANMFSNAVFYAMPTLPTPYAGCTQPASTPTGSASPVPGD